MKKLTALILSAAMLLAFAACAQGGASSSAAPSGPASSEPASSEPAPSSEPQAAPKADISIAALKGPTAMGLVKLFDRADKGEAANNYEITLAGAPDELTGRIINGDLDIAAVPINLAATLYNKTGGKVKIAAVNTLGVLYILESGDTVKSVADLAGKTVYSTGKGASPEFAFNYILEKNGVASDVTMEYKTEHAELAALLAEGKADLALLPQPFVTTTMLQNDKLRVALDLTQEWNKASGGESEMITGCIVVQQSFIDENPQALAAFLEEYKASADFVTDPANIDAAAELIVARGILPQAPVAKKALPECNIVFIAGGEMKNAAGGYIKVLFDADPASVGGKLPDDGFYYLG